MKTILFLIFFSVIILKNDIINAQPWSYDFGSAGGSYTTPSGSSTTFLPQPATGGGTSFVTVGTNANGGGFYLNKPGIPALGTFSELKIISANGVAVNKMAIYDYIPGKQAYLSFSCVFGNSSGNSANTGDWYFYIGNGPLYSNTSNTSVNLNQSFVTLRVQHTISSNLLIAYHNGTSWINISQPAGLNFNQRVVNSIGIYANNTNVTTEYLNTIPYTVNPFSWDLWINGQRIGINLHAGNFAANADMDSWLIGGEKAVSNAATLYLDDFDYSNTLPPAPKNPLPVELILFNAYPENGQIIVEWSTASETNNDYFTIERSANAKDFDQIVQITGAGNSNSLTHYSFDDTEPLPDINYYRLKQTDYDGTTTYSKIVAVHNSMQNDNTISIDKIFIENGFVVAEILTGSEDFRADIYNMTGVHCSSADKFQGNDGLFILKMPLNNLPAGIYILKITGLKASASEKFYKK